MRRDPCPRFFAGSGSVRSTPRGSLERHLPQSAPTEDELYRLRQAAWLKQELVVIRLTDVRDGWLRQAFVNEAIRLYGVRRTP
jgi:hypothetical protein